MTKTTEEMVAELLVAIDEGKKVVREIHEATKDFKQALKVERARHEEIVRLETHNTILDIAADIHRVSKENVDQILAELRKRMLGEE